MASKLLPLFPAAVEPVPLQGLYLGLRLRRDGTPQRPMVFANFLASMDGRIAVSEAGSEDSYVPASMRSASDFRLLQELIAQTDCIITHGSYMRALAAGKLGDVLRVGLREDSRDLARWRLAEGLAPHPAIAIASASLDFTVPDFLRSGEQPCYIATGAGADPRKVAYWRQQGLEVIVAGSGRGVEGRPLVSALGAKGLRCLYLSTGPWMLESMLRDGQLSRVFHTTTHQLIGGDSPLTMLSGAELKPACRLALKTLYYESAPTNGVGQLFAQYDVSA